MNSFIEKILAMAAGDRRRVGTQLQARGLAIGEFPDAWNLQQPAKVARWRRRM